MPGTGRLVARVLLLLLLTVLALLASAVAHVASLFGLHLPSAVMGLDGGVLVLGLPAMYVAGTPKRYPPQGWPRWLKAIVLVLAAYAALNAPLTLCLGGGLESVAAEVAAYYPVLRPADKN